MSGPDDVIGTGTAVRGTDTVGFVRDLRTHGDRTAVLAADGTALDYRELADRVDDVADRLGPERRLVLVAAGAGVDPLVTYLGAVRGGHPVLLSSPAPDRLAALTAAYDPDVVAAPQGSGWDLSPRRPGSAHELHPELALLLTTSGSTGSPKLVRLPASAVQANAESIADYLDVRETDRAPAMLPLHYCYGLSVLHSNLLRGAALVLPGTPVTEPAFWDTARAYGVTSLHGVPHTFDQLDALGWPPLPSLRYVTQAGGRLDPERVRTVARRGRAEGWRLFVMYGQTEATARMAYLPPDLAESRPEAIGVPIPGGDFELAPADGAGPGLGELIYRGPNVMFGYAREPADLARGREVEALATGDLARRGPDGLYELAGRLSRFVKLFGVRIDLDDVERTLAARGVTALATGDDSRLLLGVVGADAGPVAADTAVRLGLPPDAVHGVALDALPYTDTGKVDRPAVQRLAGHTGDQGDGSVRAAFARVFGLADVPGDATFRDLGGDSLRYVQMSTALTEILGDPPADWPGRTVAELEGAARRRRKVRPVETPVLLRAVGIVLVLVAHVGPVAVLGGAHLLLALAGWSFARFTPATGVVSRRLLGTALRIAVPTVLWLSWRAAVEDDVGLHNLLLANVVVDPELTGYWFVESLLQILLVLAAVFALPPVRRAERRVPFGFAAGALVAGLLMRPWAGPVNGFTVGPFAPQQVFWIFTLGWLAQRADTPGRRLAVLGLLPFVVPGGFSDPTRTAVLVLGVALILGVDRMLLPHALAKLTALVAGASLTIYLTHYAVLAALHAHLPGPVVVLACLVVGVGAWLACRLALRAREWFVGSGASQPLTGRRRQGTP
ncbi:AMP-binding protein [Pseudonocardia sp. C8]|uniref:AMP-binding protein n=1 Tax=Pseudonocardia sp. C8 TaxID=2762759 RepID=UPI001642C05B|nr:AMP-binding protein [Pseudonocardia sp. C8]